MHSSHKTDQMNRQKPLKSQWERPTNHTGKPSHRKGKQDKRKQQEDEAYA